MYSLLTPRQLAGGVVAMFITASSAFAGFTASGTWDANWVVGVYPYPTQQSGNASGSLDLTGGSATAQVDSPYKPSTITAELTGSSGNTPAIRSKLRIDMTSEMKPMGENTPSSLMLHIESKIQADFSDTLTVSNFPAEGGYLLVDLTWSGTYQRYLDIIQTEAVVDYKLEAGGSLGVFTGLQQIGTLEDPLAFYSSFDGTIYDVSGSTYQDTDNAFITGFIPAHPIPSSKSGKFRIPISNGQATVPFALNFTDDLSLEFDATADQRFIEKFEIWAERNFSNTIDIRLGVEDLNGNLLEGASISSADGYSYDPVPEPTSAAVVLGLGCVMLGRRW